MAQRDRRTRLASVIAALCAAFDREADAATAMAYDMALDDLSIDVIEAAAAKALKVETKMPPPARLRELAGVPKPADRGELAWATVIEAIRHHGAYTSVSFEDPATTGAVRGLGGWLRLCDVSTEELHTYTRHAFMQAYRAWTDKVPCEETFAGLFALDPKGIVVRARIRAPYLEIPTAPRLGDCGPQARIEGGKS